MNKNKIVGIVVWFLTLVLPLKYWMFNDFGTGITSLFMFIGAVTGTFLGGYFFSKKVA